MLKITSAEFLQGVADLRQLPKNALREVLFIGRSNVGKSSLLNKMCNRKNLARSSSTPGKTREINYYVINNAFYFVDLPGYGFARVPRNVVDTWAPMLEEYLRDTPQLRAVVVLLDMRREPDERDSRMIAWLKHYNVPALYVFTKADKLNRQEFLRAEQTVSAGLGITERIIPTSATSGLGLDELRSRIFALLSGR